MSKSRTQLLARVAALVLGLGVLLGATVVSLGVALCAPVGIWAVRRFRRARGQSLDSWSGWIAAVSATTIGLLLAAAFVASRVPEGSWSVMRHAADSASAAEANKPPPAWLDRVAPGAARYSALTPNQSPTLNSITMIWGAGIGVGILGCIIGTIGWIGTMLLVFYASGGWLHDAPPAASEPADA